MPGRAPQNGEDFYEIIGTMQTSAKRLLTVSSSLLLALVLAELFLRFSNILPAPPVNGWKWASPAGRNALGFHGNRLSGNGTVLLVGDSQVATGYPLKSMPEVFLRDELLQRTGKPFRVISVAESGWGQDQQLLALREVFSKFTAIKPQYVCLWFTPGNDLWNNTFPTHYPANGTPKPTFWLKNGKLAGPHAGFMQPWYRHHLLLLRALDLARKIPDYVTDEEWEKILPPAYEFKGDASKAVSLASVLAEATGMSLAEATERIKQENFRNEKTHYDVYLSPPSPRLHYSVKLTHLLLKEIQQLSVKNGSQLLVFYADTDFNAFTEPVTITANGSDAILWKHEMDQRISEALSEFEPLRITVSAKSRKSKSDAHLNEDANHYVMARLAEWLITCMKNKEKQ
jgi:hypothetical protein